MSESIVRKVQPFTIGTRLSVPAVSKCQDFTPNYLQSPSLDNCTLQHSLNSLYLSRSQVCAHGPRVVSPVVQSVSPVTQEDMAAEDQLNQNIVSAAAVARSIKKIAISGHKDRAENRTACVFVTATTENNNNNNNVNSSAEKMLPRIVGVSCENKPNSQFKVLLRKEGSNDLASTQFKSEEREAQPIQQISTLEVESQRKEIRPAAEAKEEPGVASQDDCFTQRNSLFNREALQAEAWIQRKLQDLRDGSNIQRCPLQDWEEFSQTLQRDLKDFENTLIQLNQMGEQLICKMNPTSDLVKKQLSHLREQWHALKQTAANQTRAVGGAKHLQEFNTKVEKLEAWIREKEEQPSLVNVLGESIDKVQLTRRILDLKQDEQLYRTLCEEINHLALKLEKQGKADGKNIASRRKHINKMYTWSFEMNWWLKVQARLKNYHEHLQLALEVSSFYQQADNVLLAIHNVRKSSASKELDKLGDQEIRDIAGQIMMLDVSVSQLSNLHPALADGVTQKQSEVKESWALLQKTLRTDRPAPPATSSTFSREDGDPLTSPREQCIVGTELQRTMGKEVKEEQNRLKGFVGTADAAISRTSSSPQESANRPSSPAAEEPAVCANDVTARHQAKGESRKPRAEPKPAALQPGHPPLHVQLQKFTVSADKTLSWLKDNVHMATQVCSIASFEGLDAARRCQQALEQEILNNRARIEVVKREGRELVRAQHPGSSRIEEFVGQLEVLWEELRRRHQRNALFLQASEELGFRVVKVLQTLGSLDAWLESVELSMKESSLAADPETMSVAERQSCLLEREVMARGPELSALRQEVERLHCHSHPLTRGLPARMEDVETKYQRLQSALTQQSSELQDTRMLAEFLEQVELEESQDLSGSHFRLAQPLHSEMSPAPTLMDLRGSVAADPLIESMGDPVEELREAVEMLNDTVRERGRSQNHDQAIRELLSKHASLAVRVEESLCRCKDLGLDILEKETDMAVQCEPDRCGLDSLWERQDHLEIDYEVIREEVVAVETLASHLQELCPERVHVFGAKIQATLQAWSELGASVEENKSRLREFVQLQDFFRSYLRMISWTEDTRSCIFSDAALHHGKDGKAPMAAKLDLQIEQKFEEFEELAATGRNILDTEHHLSQMVRERMEELRSMLGWISVHWRAQKQQWLHKLEAQENVYSIMCSSLSKPAASAQQVDQSVYSPILSHDEERRQSPGESQSSSTIFKPATKQTEDGYEVMKSVPLQSPDAKTPESPKSSVFVLKDKSSPGLGNTVNLILSFGNTGDSQVQVLDVPVTEEDNEPVCRVSTYLHVKDNNLAPGPVYESITLPRQKSHSSASPSSPAFVPSPPSSPPAPANPSQVNNFHASAGGGTSIFSSLKRISKKRKRRRDTRRHTIQKIMGVEEQEEEIPKSATEAVIYDTRTWPLKEGRRKQPKCPANVSKSYMKNPLLKDIESECAAEYNITPYAVSEGPKPPASHVKSHCRFLSLGSVLSFDLPKDMTLIPSIQDIITIAPPDSKKATGADPDPHSQRQSALSSFKQTRPALLATTLDETAANCPKEIDSTVDNALKRQSPHDLNDEQGIEESGNQLQVECDASLKEEKEPRNKTKCPNQSEHPPIYINHAHASACRQHECLSVHTLIKDLNGHKYHKCERPHNGQSHSQASHMVVNLKSTVNVSVRQDSVDSGISSLGSVKLSSDVPCAENPQPKGIVGKMVSLDVGCIANCKASERNSTDSVHVDHQQFEEVEEELEGIWGQNLRNSICSDIMYQANQETLSFDQPVQPVSPSPSPKSPAVLYRHLVTASAPNLLVAEFKLPPSVQSLLGYDRDTKRHLPPLAVGERRSWAAFPNSEPLLPSSCGGTGSVAVNETASDPVKLPEIEDGQRYIYQYREEEEEEEEEAGEEDPTGCSKDPSLSPFSADEEGDCQQSKSSPTTEELKTQGRTMTTGGRCIALSGWPELQTMEGALDRKQRLQLGGKKAASRGWSSCHAVLYRHTLCFYQDRKDTLRSSVCGLPLNLIGADCVPAPEYTKKPNCFHLRLRDGSEYLLNAPSRFMMKKWIMKIQASTVRPEAASTGLCRDTDFAFSIKPSESCGCPDPVKCLCSSQHDVTSTFPRLKPRGAAQTAVVLREFTHVSQSHGRSTQEQRDPCSAAGASADDDDDDDSSSSTPVVTQTPENLTNTSPVSQSSQRRSHSFTSATYQKISPASSRPGGRGAEKGSNYCVTLLVGDKSRDVPSIGRTQPPLLGVTEPSAPKYYTSLPRPRNKSVFKKFFGRKDY